MLVREHTFKLRLGTKTHRIVVDEQLFQIASHKSYSTTIQVSTLEPLTIRGTTVEQVLLEAAKVIRRNDFLPIDRGISVSQIQTRSARKQVAV